MRSPKLDPIKHPWDILFLDVFDNYCQFKTIEQLKILIQHAWRHILNDILTKIIDQFYAERTKKAELKNIIFVKINRSD